jgi:hypothetical protein|tara:strand:+ start:506 stop:817 length:312 start_codon:yes stop_codon:yes gene_type:complete
MAFKMSGFSAFTKTVDPVIGGNTKKEIDPALNQDDPDYKPSWKTKQELKKKNKKTILESGLNPQQVANFNKIINNASDYEESTVETAKQNLKFHNKYIKRKNK